MHIVFFTPIYTLFHVGGKDGHKKFYLTFCSFLDVTVKNRYGYNKHCSQYYWCGTPGHIFPLPHKIRLRNSSDDYGTVIVSGTITYNTFS